MGKSQSKKVREFLRGVEWRRKQQIVSDELTETQQLITKDYIQTHCQIERKNSKYPVTEKVLHGSPDELKTLLGAELKVNPYDFPDGLVIADDFFKLTLNL